MKRKLKIQAQNRSVCYSLRIEICCKLLRAFGTETCGRRPIGRGVLCDWLAKSASLFWKNCRDGTMLNAGVRHVSVMPHILLIATFSHISAKCSYRIFLPHKLAFLTAILILFVFLLLISIRFRYPDHLVAKKMAPSMCPDPRGTRWSSWFRAILYHVSVYLVFMRSANFFKMPPKTDMHY